MTETKQKRALITGITGQDGSYLAELLLSKGYEVHGLIRRSSSFNTARIDHIYQPAQAENHRMFLHFADLSDGSRLVTLLNEIQPDEVYNLAAQSHVRVSFDEPEYTGETTGLGTIRLLEAIRAQRSRMPLLPGQQFRDVRCDPAAAERGNAVLPALALRRREGVLATGSPATTARPTACSPATASCSTTSRRAAAAPS